MKSIAVFWDQSFLWGLFVYETLTKYRIPFELLNAQRIREGAIEHFKILIVPGGWASQKVSILGKEGEEAIKRFLVSGGSYVGFCGGAGLALSGANTLNILPLKRLSLENRLPSASGTVKIRLNKEHPAFSGLFDVFNVSIWWPSQFAWKSQENIFCLAFYEGVGDDFWVSDLPFKEIENLEELQTIYGINLDPMKYLINHPAMVEYRYGAGRLVLSYPHLETPDDKEGNELFLRILGYLENSSCKEPSFSRPTFEKIERPGKVQLEIMEKLIRRVSDLIEFGHNLSMWFWRRPWLLAWRRGVRGLEYSMLFTCLYFLRDAFEIAVSNGFSSYWHNYVVRLEELLAPFLEKARQLVEKEHDFSSLRPLPKLGAVNEEIDALRNYLFGSKMNHGGLCKAIFDIIDKMLYDALVLLENHSVKILLHRESASSFNFSS